MNKILSFTVKILIVSMLFSCTEEDDSLIPSDDRDQFLGTWNVNETCSKNNYQVTIIKDPSNSAQVIINNFWHIPSCVDPPFAIVARKSVIIPKQSICSDGFETEGSGTLDKNNIEWTYKVSDGAEEVNCTATYTKVKD
jgi:hypothetical protein